MSITSLDENNSYIQLYKSVTLPSADIIRADSSYNKYPQFSDVAIVMNTMDTTTNYITDQGICFGKVSIINNNQFSPVDYINS